MAGEEGDTELRDLVAQTLETQGVLGKIRAQLRASVFLALEQDKKDKPSQTTSSRFSSFMQTEDGRLTAGLVREFLQFFELDFSCSVFDPETNVLRYYNGREKLATDTGLSSTTDSPLLLQLLKRARTTPTLLPLTTDQYSTTSAAAAASIQPASLPPLSSKATPISLPPAPPTLDTLPQSSSLKHSNVLTLTGTGNATSSLTPVTLTSVLSSSAQASIPSTIPSLSIASTSSSSNTQQSKATLATGFDIARSSYGGPGFMTSQTTTTSTTGGLTTLTAFLEPNGPDSKAGKLSNNGDDSDDDTVSSQKWVETTDHSLSQSTLADEEFDHTEQVQ